MLLWIEVGKYTIAKESEIMGSNTREGLLLVTLTGGIMDEILRNSYIKGEGFYKKKRNTYIMIL